MIVFDYMLGITPKIVNITIDHKHVFESSALSLAINTHACYIAIVTNA